MTQAITEDAPRSPFSPRKKLWITSTAMWVTWNSNLGSSLPSGAAQAIQDGLGVEERESLVWLNSLYMLGYAAGPLLFGPLSEHIGRRPVILGAYLGYMVCTVACALSDRLALLLAFRFLTGFVASAPNATVGGLLADAEPDGRARGRAMAYFTCAAVAGPVFGPLFSGFAQAHSWQLTFWVGLAIAGAGLPLPIFLPETFAPVLERRRRRRAAVKANQVETQDMAVKKSLFTELRIVFTRPAIMLVREPIVLWTSLYLALIYSILYLFFQAYPVIFGGVYGLSPAFVGLGYLPSKFKHTATCSYASSIISNFQVLAGIFLGLGVVFLYDAWLARSQGKELAWALNATFRRLPLACLGGPLLIVGLFWLGWASTRSVPSAIPMLSGLAFGAGYMLIFVAMVNYLSDAYREYSASAHSAASTTRSLAAAFLPVAAAPLVLSAVPFVFMRFNDNIQRRSKFCQKLAMERLEAAPVASAQYAGHNTDGIKRQELGLLPPRSDK
ncbi:MFS-type efflux pump MFS2 [Paramyrothecium foliicola]|nr:MFS-type efflux pump MFS2 [Paramyrothecium foliicola]